MGDRTKDTTEGARLRAADEGSAPWRAWGPYVAERAWGTVREDYSASGDAWGFFPHDHARSRVYRWNEDGMAGICDQRQTFCLSLALWNGVDPILKERMFGLTGPEGNHGEDVKECWWYLDSTPTHSWMRWRYHYPQRPFVLALGGTRAAVDYEPAESTTGLFGGNSNWRGPVWFPVNVLIIEGLRRFAAFFGEDLVVEHPTGSGCKHTLAHVADDLEARLVSIFLDEGGRWPVFGGCKLFQSDPRWREQLWFHEYFHGDTGAGLGASHQTGWTGLVAELLLHRT